MNAIGLQRDLTTLVHESGHTMHNLLTKDIAIEEYNSVTSEIAELASMSMEFLTMDYWDNFYKDKGDLRKAKREQLEGTLTFLPWCMTVDAFQHWIYTNPNHSPSERRDYFGSLVDRFNADVDWSGLDDIKKTRWMRQLHIFEVPFYYIEYGISQLGALAVYRNYRHDPKKAIKEYRRFLASGYKMPMDKIYEQAGIKFDFSVEYIGEIVDFVRKELDELK
jgi:oligoendopeptidase F